MPTTKHQYGAGYETDGRQSVRCTFCVNVRKGAKPPDACGQERTLFSATALCKSRHFVSHIRLEVTRARDTHRAGTLSYVANA